MVPICVNDPMGLASPFRTAMTPAMVVVLTAPRPTSRMPTFPPAGAIEDGLVTAQNYIIRVSEPGMSRWLRQGPSPHQTALAMIGPKPADRVVMIGGADPDLAAAVALVTGLNGQLVVMDARAEAEAAVASAAARAGALVDFAQMDAGGPHLAPGAEDVIVLLTSFDEPEAAPEAVRRAVEGLRAGGRLVVIDGQKPAGLFGGLTRKASRVGGETILPWLREAGLVAARQLADVDGVGYFEARKP
jgi:hypothetical protein